MDEGSILTYLLYSLYSLYVYGLNMFFVLQV